MSDSMIDGGVCGLVVDSRWDGALVFERVQFGEVVL
jgi:hypothetical protein